MNERSKVEKLAVDRRIAKGVLSVCLEDLQKAKNDLDKAQIDYNDADNNFNTAVREMMNQNDN